MKLNAQPIFNESKPSVVIVDDEQNILSSLQRMLHTEGYHIRTATSGFEALVLLEECDADLIVSDMRMPRMDGAEFLRQVAQKWPDTARILLTGYADLRSTIKAINAGNIYKYISKPWEDYDLKLQVKLALEKRFLERERRRLQDFTDQRNQQLREFNVKLEGKVQNRTAKLVQSLGRIERVNESLKQNYTATVKILANLIGLREDSMSGHSRRVANLALNLANKIHIPDEQAQQVLFAGLLHDIGKISLPDKLIRNSFDRLLYDEQVRVNKHPIIGESLLMGLQPLQRAAEIIRSHHECFDGSGFPDGKKGEDIPLGARILAVVSDYDAVTHGMLTAKLMSADQAKVFLSQNSGTRYDPDIVNVFLAQLDRENQDTQHQFSVCVTTSALKEGMTLAGELVTRNGMLLLSEGFVLNANVIKKITDYEKHSSDNLKIMVIPNGEISCIESC